MGWQRWEREQREAGAFLAGSRCDEAVEGDSARGFKSVSVAAEEYGVHACAAEPAARRGGVSFFKVRVQGEGSRAAAYPSLHPLKHSQEKGKGLAPVRSSPADKNSWAGATPPPAPPALSLQPGTQRERVRSRARSRTEQRAEEEEEEEQVRRVQTERPPLWVAS